MVDYLPQGEYIGKFLVYSWNSANASQKSKYHERAQYFMSESEADILYSLTTHNFDDYWLTENLESQKMKLLPHFLF